MARKQFSFKIIPPRRIIDKDHIFVATQICFGIFIFVFICPSLQVTPAPKQGWKQPDTENLTHCTYHFSDFNDSSVTCNNITAGEDLFRNMEFFRGTIDEITDLYFNNTILSDWPPDVFQGINVQRVQFVNTELPGLTVPGTEQFIMAGVENSLMSFSFRNSRCDKWDWKAMSQLRALRILELVNTNIDEIPSSFNQVGEGNVEQLQIEGHNLKGKIADDAFASFPNLQRIRLTNNSLDVIKRSMFPNPAMRLYSFLVDHNEITEIPEDLFDNMKNLTLVYLSYNKITRVSDHFQKVWDKVKTFLLSGNPLHCDCKLIWLLRGIKSNEMMTKFVRGLRECATPPKLKGLYLRNLQESDLVCAE